MCSLTCHWKSELERPVYIGVLIPTRRGFRVLPILSPSRLQIAADTENSGRGYIRFKRIALTGMNSDSGQVNGLLGWVSLNGSGFTAGTECARLLAGPTALASWAVGPHVGGGRLGRYVGRVQWEGRKAMLGRLGFDPYCQEN
jgi:hypothetical protein